MASGVMEMGSSIAGSLANMIGVNTGLDSSWELREKSCCAHQMKSFSKLARRRLPITSWVMSYRPVDLFRDSLAGLILGFTLIPQSIVFASVANVPLQYGLYSSIVGHFLYCIFGTVREMSIGPSAVMGLLISDYSFRGGADYPVLLCFLSGCVELLFAVLNLGFLIDFISAPVNCGFSSAAAVMITATQLRTVLGLNISADNFFDGIYQTYQNINNVNYWDTVLGSGCIIILLLLRYLNSLEWMDPGPFPTKKQRIKRRIVRLISTGRNVIIITAAATIAYYLSENNINVLTLTAGVDAGLPIFHLPPFSTVQNNVTHNFIDMCKDLGPGIFLVPVLSILQHIVVAKVFFRGKSVDDTQEILALGLSNFFGAFLSALPTAGNLPRSALNSNNGVRSPFVGVFAGGIILLALQFLTPYFNYIPQAALASMVICAVIFMLKCNVVTQLWKASKTDSFTMITTFICCIVLGAEYGILVGIALSLAVLLYSSARPNILVKVSYEPPFILIQPDRMLNFPAVEYVRYKVIKIADQKKKFPIMVDGSHLCGMDFTVAECVKELMEEFQNRKQLLIFTDLQKSVIQVIKGSLLPSFNYFPSVADAEVKLREGLSFKSKDVVIDEKNNGDIAVASTSIRNSTTINKSNRSELKHLGSDCSDPYEHTAWFNLVVSIPRLKIDDNRKSLSCYSQKKSSESGCDNCDLETVMHF